MEFRVRLDWALGGLTVQQVQRFKIEVELGLEPETDREGQRAPKVQNTTHPANRKKLLRGR